MKRLRREGGPPGHAAVAIGLVAAGVLVAFGGAYDWIAVPLVLSALALAAVTRPRLFRDPLLDLTLLAYLAGLALQVVPWPLALVARVSPKTAPLQATLQLLPTASGPATTISIVPGATWHVFWLSAATMLLFAVTRDVLATAGGTRVLVRLLAWTGLLMSMAAIAQRLTAPALIYWQWRPLDAGSRPLGPFVNRNHFATWLILAGSCAAGYLMAHVRTHLPSRPGAGAAIRAVFRPRGVELALAVLVMAATLVFSLSRSGLLGAACAVAAAALIARRRFESSDRRRLVVFACAAAVVAWTVADPDQWLGRLQATVAGTDRRPLIWRDTLDLIRDFWAAGTGAGTYAQAMLVYQRSDHAVFFNQAHSQYLQVMAEGGLLLVVPAIAAVAALARTAARRLARDVSEMYWLRLGAAAGLVGIAAQGVWETGLRMPANSVLAAILAAILVHDPCRGAERERSQP